MRLFSFISAFKEFIYFRSPYQLQSMVNVELMSSQCPPLGYSSYMAKLMGKNTKSLLSFFIKKYMF